MSLSETVERKFIETIEVSDWEIETDTGWTDIITMSKTIPYSRWHLETDYGKTLDCADTHIIFDENMNEMFAKDSLGKRIQTADGLERVFSLVDTGIEENMYDLEVSDSNHRFYSNRILSHNSTTTVAVFLHYVLFNDNVNVAILANKAPTAREILSRLQRAFEYLPKWLQQGVREWNKGNIELENGSKVMATSTSSSSVRGQTFNWILLDEFAHVQRNIQDEFFTSTYPTISSGKTSKITIVSTPCGMELFYKIWTEAEEGRNSYIPYNVQWHQVPGRDEKWKNETIANTSQEEFDQEFGNQFLGSTNTLIETAKLKCLTFKTPLEANNCLKIYEYPKLNHSYILLADVSQGKGIDNSAFSIIDITQCPFIQVATYYNPNIPTLLYPTVIYQAAKKFNNALVLIETNDIGHSVSESLFYDLEYEFLISTVFKGRAGQQISSGFGKNVYRGLRTTTSVKKSGCQTLKSLIEGDKLIIHDFDTIAELTAFAQKGRSYEAEPGHHDDLVTTLILFSWCTQQKYFKDLSNIDIRHDMFEDNIKEIEETLTPFGIYDDGLSGVKNGQGPSFIDASGQPWYPAIRDDVF